MLVKLTYIIDTLAVGGAEKLLLSTLKKLNKEKYDITVCTMMKENDLIEDFRKLGVKVVCLNMYNKRDIRGFFKLYRYFKSHKIEIVHTHLVEANIFGRYAALLAGVPIIISTEHSVDDWKANPQSIKSKLRLFFDKIAANHSNGIIAVSDKIKKHIINYEKINPAKITVIKNGIEIEKFDNSFNNSKKGNTIVLGSVGRLCKAKGYEYLLKAFIKVKEKISNTKLLIAGDGPLREQLEKLARNLHISTDVTFMGVLNNIPAFLNEIDIFVLSSVREGLPLSLLEAMAAEKPIIATAVGGIPEVIDNGSDGIIVTATNVDELKDAIISLLQDEDKRRAIGKNARNKVINYFSIESMVNELESFYDGLILKL